MGRLSQTKDATITIQDDMMADIFSNLEVKSASISGMSRSEVDVTHYGSSTFMEFEAAARADGGSFSFTINLDTEDLGAVVSELTSASLSTILYTYPLSPTGGNNTEATFTFDGFMTSYSQSLPATGGIDVTMEYRVAQNVAFTDEVTI